MAGIVFANAELGRRFEHKTNGVMITAIVLSGLVSMSLPGNDTYFGELTVGIIDRKIMLPFLFCGLVCGFDLWFGLRITRRYFQPHAD